MFRRSFPLFAIAFVLLPLSLRADGFIYIPDGPDMIVNLPDHLLPRRRPGPPKRHFPLSITRHRVLAEINDGLVKTRVEETFHNSSGGQLEGYYMFPLPDGAAASGFTMKIAGKVVKGEVLDKDKARSICSRRCGDMRRRAWRLMMRRCCTARPGCSPNGIVRRSGSTWTSRAIARRGSRCSPMPLPTIPSPCCATIMSKI